MEESKRPAAELAEDEVFPARENPTEADDGTSSEDSDESDDADTEDNSE